MSGGCCDCCGGTGADLGCGGPCWSCRGTGCAHTDPCDESGTLETPSKS